MAESPKFLDEVFIHVASGKGGAGCTSFRRESYVPRGGPDGGDGGRGGHVFIRVDSSLNSLIDLRNRKKYVAFNGVQGSSSCSTGADGKDLYISVPRGTVVKDESGYLLADLEDGDVFKVAQGGRGGKGNHFFKTSVNQAPEHSQPGEKGEEKTVFLELKLIADVGIIGFPNAGKSTLISKISAAKPKIADYPFTTLVPNLGVVKIDEQRSWVVADIPGLIPGAHKGVGLGHQFLKHIERTRIFAHVIDASEVSGRQPFKDYQELQWELEAYDSEKQLSKGEALMSREQIVVLNKTDIMSEEQIQDVEGTFQKQGILTLRISSATGQGLKKLVQKINDNLLELDLKLQSKALFSEGSHIEDT